MQSTATKSNKGAVRTRFETVVRPRADIRELDDHYAIEVELPGAEADKVDLQVENDELRLTAPKPRAQDGTRYLARERRSGTYRRVFHLGEQVDRQGITGDFSDGVLKIRIPKTVNALPRKIEVKG